MYDLSTKIRAIRLIRFDPDKDLLLELSKFVIDEKIKNAVIQIGRASCRERV